MTRIRCDQCNRFRDPRHLKALLGGNLDDALCNEEIIVCKSSKACDQAKISRSDPGKLLRVLRMRIERLLHRPSVLGDKTLYARLRLAYARSDPES